MAASATIEGDLIVNDVYTIDENLDEVDIHIGYGSKILNLNRFARISDIKRVAAKLYINNKETGSIISSKTNYVGSDINLKVDRKTVEASNDEYYINIRIDSEFSTIYPYDGIMLSSMSKDIKVTAKPKAVMPPSELKEDQIEFGILNEKTSAEDSTVENIYKSNLSDEYNVRGFIEAGKILAIKLKNIQKLDKANLNITGDNSINIIDNKTKLFYDKEYANRGQKLDSLTFEREFKLTSEKDNKKTYVLYTVIPIETNTSIYSTYSLREKYGSLFDVINGNILSRKSEPYVFNINLINDSGTTTCKYMVDIYDDWVSNINKSIKQYVSHYGNEYIEDKSIWETS